MALMQLGVRTQHCGVHTARTMMLQELSQLLEALPEAERGVAAFRQAIEANNVLNKRSTKSRELTRRHLADLYGLDPALLVFRGLCHFWDRDEPGRPLIALSASIARDALLAEIAPEILQVGEGATVSRESVEALIEARHPGRFSPATLRSVAQNINSTFTQSGHLAGRVKKVRQQAQPTCGSVAYALLLAFASGARGSELFRSPFMQVQDAPQERAIELAEEAARKGWVSFKRVGDVMEAAFPRIVTAEELRIIREQG